MDILKKTVIGILAIESRLVIRKYKPFVVAVTGSVGKTSAKDAIYDVLLTSRFRFVRKSEKSLNSEIGLPLTIIGAPNAWHSLSGWIRNILAGWDLITKKSEYPDCLILEIGADHPRDIKRVVRWLKPDIAVITKVSRTPVHVEFFKSPEEVFEEKAALAAAVKPGGKLVLFADDDGVMSLAERVKDRGVSIISYGLNEKAAVRGSDTEIEYDQNAAPTGSSFVLNISGVPMSVKVAGTIGQACIYPLLAAAAVGQAVDMTPAAIHGSMERYKAPRGRMNVIPGLNGSTLIDDTYNSSPDAAVAALEALRDAKCQGAKIAVLGDMMELGRFSAEEHRRIGKEAAIVVDQLITVGQRSHLTAEEAIKSGLSAEAIRTFDSSAEAAAYLQGIVKAGDIVLIKGSQSIRTERVSKALLREPARAAELLVRQEKEWLEKK